MNALKTHPALLKPEVLLRFVLATDAVSATEETIAPDTWVDFDTAFGPQFQRGTEHTLTLLSPPNQAIAYRVTKTPFLKQVAYKNGRVIPMTTLYLAPAA